MKFEERDLQELWDRMGVLDGPVPPTSLRTNFHWMLRGARAARHQRRAPMGRLLAAAALVFVGIAAGLLWQGNPALPVEQTRVLHALTAPGAPAAARLAAVDLFSNKPSEHETALLRLAASDPSVNVRLAVLDALLPIAAEAAVVERLPRILKYETEPLPRLALVDLIVAGDAHQATPILQRIAQDPAQDTLVIEKATWALQALQQRRPKS